jgi:hypothetical protein
MFGLTDFFTKEFLERLEKQLNEMKFIVIMTETTTK